jgi:hypothetical protein
LFNAISKTATVGQQLLSIFLGVTMANLTNGTYSGRVRLPSELVTEDYSFLGNSRQISAGLNNKGEFVVSTAPQEGPSNAVVKEDPGNAAAAEAEGANF